MRNEVFITRLASGAVAASVAGAWMLPQKQAQVPSFSMPAREAVYADVVTLPQGNTETAEDTATVLTISESPSAWDKKLEKEFRSLALAEAKETLTVTQSLRLDELNCLRNRLLKPMTPEEISVQLKRDRLLTRMEDLLREYVEFQEATGKKRAVA
jgi:hypothetical protein